MAHVAREIDGGHAAFADLPVQVVAAGERGGEWSGCSHEAAAEDTESPNGVLESYRPARVIREPPYP